MKTLILIAVLVSSSMAETIRVNWPHPRTIYNGTLTKITPDSIVVERDESGIRFINDTRPYDICRDIYKAMGGKIVLIRTDTGKVTPEHDVTVPETVEWR